MKVIRSQSLLNEVKFPTKGTGKGMCRKLTSQSLLNEVKFPTLGGKNVIRSRRGRNPF